MKKSILAISERKEILKQVRKELLGEYEVITFNNFLDGLDMLRESDFDIILLDQNMTWFTFTEVRRKLNGIGKDFVVVGLIEEETDEVLKDLRGADIYNYLLKPLCIKEFNKLIFPALQSLSILKEKRKLEKKLSDTEEIKEIVGQSTKIKEIKNLIDKIAESDLTVLISGENGVGKELIAAEIYKKSDRRKKNFMVISCASMSSDIIESELFGYERDVFPGSGSGKVGILEEADGGTVFLDEITGLDIKAQAKLLRVIEYGEFRRVGGNKTKRVDIRFIVSTNKNLKTEVESGKFRSDLYHRLTAFPIEMAPLRERKDDIPLLANYFLNKIVVDIHREMPIISSDAMKYLMEYSYPGNIRELKNIIERMVILSTDRVIGVEDLPLEIKMKSDTLENKTIIGLGPLKEILEKELYNLADVEKVVIATALQKTRWNKQETAKLLGIGRTTLYEKIRRYKLDQKG
ncbi:MULTISPECIES: sigma-54 dependent transcriptional regulator [Psychrilyobacter]|uniref:Response regulator n=1 Tax=Psychrilyobacter piezotolerans TaxID=2293438 RepID=A0ABX9KGK8_9FUSO|nr:MULTISPECIES: sigma-54 dependent transcriptional regulator [Psychrilyobacter]MCS5420348.1 sigma-54 dependent transcriptional regulator [Psychrilyobacter sp. S5]NDI78070.1 sigma-54-dependent Fis family transcriptional regulator [Psychrilyobacter piezotolerans]RDE61661.1 sigma-54-dependent Fis family transcriptional regulator [Psychrilyobacter sp. S5]REI41053.1 response regulator [Psychrilyobacter piezotolerans]